MKERKTPLIFLLIAIAVMMLISGCSEKSAGSGIDNIPPADIIDFKAYNTSGCSYYLAWTAPGDDGFHGTAERYDIRYSHEISALITWDNTCLYSEEVEVLPGGYFQTINIRGLNPDIFYFFAIKAIDDAGNVSGISNIVQIYFDDLIVCFQDPMLDSYIRGLIDEAGDIYYSQLLSINEIEILNAGCSSLKGLEYIANLENIRIVNGSIKDLNPIRDQVMLREMSFYNNQIDRLQPLSALPCLETVDLGHNLVYDISPLNSMKNIQSLNLSGNSISHLYRLENLNSLEYLNLDSNLISDIIYLSVLESLEVLELAGNQISDIAALQSMVNLRILDLANNDISDISPLLDNPGLGETDTICLTNNPLSTASLKEHIPALEARGVIVNY